MGFSEEVRTRAMVACRRCCCICHKFCGNNMEVHHIKAENDGGSNLFENAIPLCFDCHAEVRQYDPRHPKGIKFSEKELIQHRDNWYAAAKNKEAGEKPHKVEPLRIVRNKNQDIMLQRVMTGRELVVLSQSISGMEYSYDEPKTGEEAILLAEFVQKVKDLIDCCDMFMEPSESIMIAFELNEDIKTLEKTGYWVFCAREKRTLTGGIGDAEPFPVLIVNIVRADNEEIIKHN